MSHTYLLSSSSTPPLVAGQLAEMQVSQDALWIVFHNASVTTDMLISLAPSRPNPTSTPGGDWSYVVPAGHSAKVPVPGTSATQTAVAPYWKGTIWLCPINQSGQLNIAGQLPGIGNLWIMTFAAGETPVDFSASSLASSQVGQQRVITLPAAPGLDFTKQTPGSGADITLKTTPLSAANIAASQVTGYVFYLSVSCGVPAVSTQVGIDFTLWADILNGGGSALISTSLQDDVAFSGQGAAASGNVTVQRYIFAPAAPHFVQLIGAGATAATWRWRLHVNGIVGAPTIFVTFGLEIDLINSNSPGVYGNNIVAGPF